MVDRDDMIHSTDGTFNAATPHIGLFTSWKRRKVEVQTEVRSNARSDEIDLRLTEEAESSRRLCDVLVMSIPDSEAAAFALVKRMKIAHEAHTHGKLVAFRPFIWKLLLKNARSIVTTIQSRDLGLVSPSNKAHCEYIMNHPIDVDSPEFLFQPKFGRAIQDLWEEQIIPVLKEHPFRLSVDNNAAYFFAEVQRIVAEDYVPSVEDALHTAERGVLETYFEMGRLSIRVVQVYGQERGWRKWINHFESVTSIIFYSSLCDYDMCSLSVECNKNRLSQSLALFDSVVNSRWFSRTSIMLFLTEITDFKAKLHDVPLARYFPEYLGGTDVNKGAKYILWRFMKLNRGRVNVYPHITESCEVSNVRLLSETVKGTILQHSLRVLDIL